ncbi:phosphoglycerate dehydrogenase [Acidobacteriota bacterium]
MKTQIKKVLISTGSFAVWDELPLKLLQESGLLVTRNPFGRKLTKEEVIDLGSDMNGILAGTESLDADVLDRLPYLEVISRCGVGLDNVDLKVADKKGIIVLNTPDGPTQAVAELTVGLIFDLLRGISRMNRQMHQNIWKKDMGMLLAGKKVGIIGFGRIGNKVGTMLSLLDAEVSFCDSAFGQKINGFENKDLEILLKESDIICIHISVDDKSILPILGKDELFSLKEGAFLVNCSRGGVVDESSLVDLLKSGYIAGAALDVFDSEPYEGPLQEFDNVILTPHIGSYAREARINMEMQAAENLIKGLGG